MLPNDWERLYFQAISNAVVVEAARTDMIMCATKALVNINNVDQLPFKGSQIVKLCTGQPSRSVY
jgi:hypothetical protein